MAHDDGTLAACVRCSQIADDLAGFPASTPSGDAMSVVWGTAVKVGTLQPRRLTGGGDGSYLRKAAVADLSAAPGSELSIRPTGRLAAPSWTGGWPPVADIALHARACGTRRHRARRQAAETRLASA